MYRKTEDFIQEWTMSADGTVNVFKAMTDDKLNQAIAENHNTLGWLAWHLTTAPIFLAKLAKIDLPAVGNPKEVPGSVNTIVSAYETMAGAFKEAATSLTDADLVEQVPAFGTSIPRGLILRKIIDHQTHHRGQMTVLLRQAGLEVPGVMGPTKEQQM